MFNRYDSTGLTSTVLEVNVQSSYMQAVAAAMRNNIVLPTVVIVGRVESKTHKNIYDIIGQDGKRLTAEDRQRIAESRKHLLASEEPDFSKDTGEVGSGEKVEVDAHLPKNFRVIRPKELNIEEIYERHLDR